MIHDVVRLNAEGEFILLPNRDRAFHGQVDVEVARSPEAVGRDVAPVRLDRNASGRTDAESRRIGGEVRLGKAGNADRVAPIAVHTAGAGHEQIRNRCENSTRRVDVRSNLAVRDVERRSAVDVHLGGHRPVPDEPVDDFVRRLEGLGPENVGSPLVATVEAQTTVAVAEVIRVLVGDRAQSVAPRVVQLAGEPVTERVTVKQCERVVVADAVVVVLGDGDEARIRRRARESAVVQAVILRAVRVGVHVGIHAFLNVVAVVADIGRRDQVVGIDFVLDLKAPLQCMRRVKRVRERRDARRAERRRLHRVLNLSESVAGAEPGLKGVRGELSGIGGTVDVGPDADSTEGQAGRREFVRNLVRESAARPSV